MLIIYFWIDNNLKLIKIYELFLTLVLHKFFFFVGPGEAEILSIRIDSIWRRNIHKYIRVYIFVKDGRNLDMPFKGVKINLCYLYHFLYYEPEIARYVCPGSWQLTKVEEHEVPKKVREGKVGKAEMTGLHGASSSLEPRPAISLSHHQSTPLSFLPDHPTGEELLLLKIVWFPPVDIMLTILSFCKKSPKVTNWESVDLGEC